jgi:Protein of unknown function (DUF3309)
LAVPWFPHGTKGRIVLSFFRGTACQVVAPLGSGFDLAPRHEKEGAMSLGLILIIIVIIYLLGGFSGRFGGYGYGMGHSGMGLGGVILVVLLVLLLLHKI